ncbi:15907_t:CDS:2 [Dentiscutata erythropus]|uniref:Nitrogen permease regulator 3 n=1 Tax=Dentiscutata erythropus TaxID=1348616 RepID=A0A9N9JHR3_9GLOM|nr:15907_t:CDS:2 [Dentiscutata erythropus]
MGVSLIAILLVIRTSRGSNLVFHYPKEPKRRDELERIARKSEDLDEFGDLLEDGAITWPYGIADDADKRSLNNAIEHNAIHNKLFGLETSVLAIALCPNPKGSSKFQLSIDDLTFVGQPVFMNRADEGNQSEVPLSKDKEITKRSGDSENSTDIDDDDDLRKHLLRLSASEEPSFDDVTTQTPFNVTLGNNDISSTSTKQQHSTFFHLVFVLDPPELELCKQVDSIHKHVIAKLTTALQYEQRRCGYVRKESELIMSLRDNTDIASMDKLMEIILEKSSLARTIRQVYESISTDSIAHVLVNDYIDLSLQIPPLAPTTLFAPDNDTEGNEYTHYPVIAPYHALLLLEDPEEILRSMPLDSNPTLVQLVQILTPTQRLADLCTVVDCSLAQIFRIAAHLIYWRKAKIIDVISVRNIYVVSPTADMNSLPTYIEYFKQHFPPDFDLVKILASLSTPKPYFKNPLVSRELHYEGNGVSHNAMDEKALISPYDKASDSEREWLNKLVNDQPRETVTMFERLTKYFNGKHHVEEILFRETIKPRDLGKILSLFSRDELIIVWC